MAVIVHRIENLSGKDTRVGKFLPERIHLDEKDIRKAEDLDKELKSKVAVINREFELKQDNKKLSTSTSKWTWLGEKTKYLIDSLKYLNSSDIYNNSIWPAINQYLHDDLKNESNPILGGGNKDHLRRCYYFYEYKFYQFLPNWTAWLEITDRGDQLIHNKTFRDSVRDTFGRDNHLLTSSDYREIAKLIVEQWPSGNPERVVIEHISPKKVSQDMNKIYKDWRDSRPA